MKKITFILTVLTMILVSCQNKNAYTIEGTFEGNTFDGKTVFLQKIDSLQAEAPTVVDSIAIKNGKFSFKGSTDNDIVLGFISVGKLGQLEDNSPVATIILEPGTIKLTLKDGGDVNIGGTPRNDEYNKVLTVMNSMAALYKEVSDAGGVEALPLDAEGNDAEARMMKLQKERQESSFNFAKANMTNKAGQFIFYTTGDAFTREQLSELVEAADSTFRNMPEILALQEELNRVMPEVGLPFVDVQVVNANGLPVALSAYAGQHKCVVIDFWASWCGPCIEEMPNLKRIYSTYKSKGLEIVGISVDDDKTAWLNAVKKYNMDWVQLADDKQLAGELYGIATIPHTIVLDQNGIIVAKDLRGKELEDKIAEILK